MVDVNFKMCQCSECNRMKLTAYILRSQSSALIGWELSASRLWLVEFTALWTWRGDWTLCNSPDSHQDFRSCYRGFPDLSVILNIVTCSGKVLHHCSYRISNSTDNSYITLTVTCSLSRWYSVTSRYSIVPGCYVVMWLRHGGSDASRFTFTHILV